MKHKSILDLICVIIVASLAGCSFFADPVKMVWGSSTYRLEKERANAIRETFDCGLAECFEAVKGLSEDTEDAKRHFEIFMSKPEEGMMVVMGVPGNIDTTEVGIFFSRVQLKQTTIEVSSLSSSAKRKVAQSIFEELRKSFH